MPPGDSEASRPVFRSRDLFVPERVRAAAVYCSDGRWGEQFDEFLQDHLALPRYDRLAVPGGAACLARHFKTYREEEGVVEQLRFLIDTHGIEQVVLIAHEGCAFYSRRLQISPLQLESQQREDLQKAVRRVQQLARHLHVHGYFARVNYRQEVLFESAV